jgi:hypothetical protein
MDISTGLYSPLYSPPVYTEMSYSSESDIVQEPTPVPSPGIVFPVPPQPPAILDPFYVPPQPPALLAPIPYLMNATSYYQRLAEEAVIKELVICASTGRYANLALLTPLSASQIKTELNGNFYATDLLKWLACSFEGTFKYKTLEGEARTHDDRITSTISELIRIGADSADGAVWSATFKTVDGFFLFKTALTKGTDDLLFHEYFVAVTCLNALRYQMSNFMYIYGVFQCAVPKEVVTEVPNRGEVRQGINYCSPNLLTGQRHGTYVVIENIPNATFWRVMVSQTQLWEVVSWLMQITDALAVAHASYGYTHYDLHSENVLLRPLGRVVYVKLPRDGRWIATKNIPTIIDYGRNRVAVGGKTFGYYNAPSIVRPDVSRPEHDLYKLLGYTMYALAGLDNDTAGNTNLLLQLIPVFQFFPHIRNTTITDVGEFLILEGKGGFEMRDRSTNIDPATFYQRFQTHLTTLFDLRTNQHIVDDTNQLPGGAVKWNCHHNMCL